MHSDRANMIIFGYSYSSLHNCVLGNRGASQAAYVSMSPVYTVTATGVQIQLAEDATCEGLLK